MSIINFVMPKGFAGLLTAARTSVQQQPPIIMKDEPRLGISTDFIFYSDYIKSDFHFMRSQIFEVAGNKLILSQTTPPLPAVSLKQEILLTYLTREESHPARFGFSARIIELIRDYEFASRDRVPAIVVQRTGDTVPFELRLHYRLKVPPSIELKFTCQGQPLSLYDFSLGGARLGYDEPIHWEVNRRLALTIEVGDRQYPIEADVLRVWPLNVKWRPGAFLAAVRFIHTSGSGPAERLLGEEIIKLQRELMANNKLD